MIAAAWLPAPARLSGARLRSAAGQGVGLVEVVEAELDGDPVALRRAPSTSWPSAASSASPAASQRRGLLGVDRRSPRPRFWLASQPNPVLGLADRPARRAPRRGRGGGGRRCRWAPSRARPWPSLSSPDSSSSSASSGSSSRRIRLETAGRLRPTRRASSSLVRPRSSTRAAQALRLLDRVEVLADHVLDQRRLQALGLGLVADDRRHLLQAGLLGGAPAALAGDQLVAAVGEGADEQRLDDAAGLDRGGEARPAPRGRTWSAAGSGSA